MAVGPATVSGGISSEGPFFTDALDRRDSQLAYVVHRARGREPLHLADYARGTAGAGIWSGSPVAV